MLSIAATLIAWIVGFFIAVAIIAVVLFVLAGVARTVFDPIGNWLEGRELRARSRELLRREKSPDEEVRFPELAIQRRRLEIWKSLLHRR